ncbi:hypothetical protein BDF21DRAFT_400096 [Thamnidium elegans]|nr:hypothetical protein BDF21DRAFT_400096 [Thamnidium elegans]
MNKLSKYYSRTDLTNVYVCATIVDPSLKFSYWKEQELETNIIEAQILQRKKSFSLFLTGYYAHELHTSDSSEVLAFRVGAAIFNDESSRSTVKTKYNLQWDLYQVKECEDI